MDSDNLHRLVDLRDWQLVNPEQDVRGFPLMSSGGERHGIIRRLLVDTVEERVALLELDNGTTVPVEDVDIRDNAVYVDSVGVMPDHYATAYDAYRQTDAYRAWSDDDVTSGRDRTWGTGNDRSWGTDGDNAVERGVDAVGDAAAAAGRGVARAAGAVGDALTGHDNDAAYATGTDRTRMGRDGDEVIPIVEENLNIGKRTVDRGRIQVRSRVVETPVSEDVSLRRETVHVERRPVADGTVGAVGGDAFRERTIEMRETAEEAVVSKDARVVEEVVLRKDVDTHVERVEDTIRRTEVDVDRVDGDVGLDRDGNPLTRR